MGAGDNGNVLGIVNNRDNTRSESFTYDSLNRIASAQTQTVGVSIPNSNCWGYTFAYDLWGNLSLASTTGPSGCSQPLPLGLSHTTANQISGYCYDSAGNLLDAGPCNTPHTYAYDAENNLTSVGATNYVYDGFGRRLWKSVTGTQCVYEANPQGPRCPGNKSLQYRLKTVTTLASPIYLYGGNNLPIVEVTYPPCTPPLECSIDYTFYAPFAGERIAKIPVNVIGTAQPNLSNAGPPDFYLADHLGSSRVVTDSSGNILDDSDFYPFGGVRDTIAPTSGNTYKFTGYQQDSESGLDYASARHYNPALGRFMSPDPLSGYPGNPQSWNRYSYVQNNPLNLIDPTGMCSGPDSDADDPDTDPGQCGDSGGGTAQGNSGPPSIAATSYDGYTASGPLFTADLIYYGASTPRNSGDFNIDSPWFLVGAVEGIYNGFIDLAEHDVNPRSLAAQAMFTTKFQPRNFQQHWGIQIGPTVLSVLIPGGGEGRAAVEGIEIVESAGRVPFAMGLDAELDAFAEARGATTWKQFSDLSNWRSGVLDKLADPETTVHFNLNGVDVWGGVQRAARGAGGATDWELLQIRQNPQFWGTLRFWRNGKIVANPF